MNRNQISFLALASAALAALLAFPRGAKAGPPLVCHPFDIGGAKSLPWTSTTWKLSGNENYDLSRLAADTLALLNPSTPVIVRMETLRRAALYARQDQYVQKELLLKLKSRATDAEASGKPDPLAWFDAGYFVETVKQADMTFQKNSSGAWDPVYAPNVASNIDGYAWVAKALRLRGDDAEMEFAAAVITSFPRPGLSQALLQKAHDEHLRKALAGATDGSLLARNLVLHYGDSGTETVAELRVKLGAK
jgi:hypothetical protein